VQPRPADPAHPWSRSASLCSTGSSPASDATRACAAGPPTRRRQAAASSSSRGRARTDRIARSTEEVTTGSRRRSSSASFSASSASAATFRACCAAACAIRIRARTCSSGSADDGATRGPTGVGIPYGWLPCGWLPCAARVTFIAIPLAIATWRGSSRVETGYLTRHYTPGELFLDEVAPSPGGRRRRRSRGHRGRPSTGPGR
jgi:hypothetical protein